MPSPSGPGRDFADDNDKNSVTFGIAIRTISMPPISGDGVTFSEINFLVKPL